ncbi:dinuclear metal center protein, YbgI/SA1388 family [Proteiniborus ethanoligenes]|uniref:GTP cyclohydrolase 1 type 2 homolog n=1 Tax=Proteiniborus ethanoligenes TaxID=415015 RepID=A0A1H3R3X4_9FIRM|nr:Nif3-like dinuclear metal center hexameric protein [Proteiniborus ethanoligenes]SDZ20296.1 dinuclear metal center protein, YbgI/SA1388 family [Proteiniborus ethanoligenes]
MLAKDIIKLINNIAPSKLIDKKWDNSGLQIGSLEKKVKKILLALDISPITVKYALDNQIDMILSHHPFFFTPIKSISSDEIKGKMIVDLVNNDIVVYSAHTNLDSAENGVSEILAKKLKLRDISVLSNSFTEKLYKVVVYVPISHKDSVRDAMTNQGAGFIGNYSHCTFNITGTGTFMPREGTNPYIGEANRLEFVQEERIEAIVSDEGLTKVLDSMLKAHPYEEVAYDIYELYNKGKDYGYGRVGVLEKESTLLDFAKQVKETLNCDSIKVYGDTSRITKRIAICGGSGIDFLNDVHFSGADTYVTGDIKYHDAQIALEKNIALIDAGHFYTENLAMSYIKNYLDEMTKGKVSTISFEEKSIPFITV